MVLCQYMGCIVSKALRLGANSVVYTFQKSESLQIGQFSTSVSISIHPLHIPKSAKFLLWSLKPFNFKCLAVATINNILRPPKKNTQMVHVSLGKIEHHLTQTHVIGPCQYWFYAFTPILLIVTHLNHLTHLTHIYIVNRSQQWRCQVSMKVFWPPLVTQKAN